MNFKEGEILYFDKPLTWTSFDLVGRIRNIITRATGEKIKVGHAGTLDPLATGIMILATGKATKQIETLQSGVKEYIATLKLGATTPSFDMEHPEDAVYPTDHITKEMRTNTLSHFKGEIMQIPPVYSAVKINGKRAFDYARKGDNIELNAKPIAIDEIEMLNLDMPYLEIRVVCSKGTYIRALARDIGSALGSGAYLTALKRTRIGNIGLDRCLTIEEFKQNNRLKSDEKNIRITRQRHTVRQYIDVGKRVGNGFQTRNRQHKCRQKHVCRRFCQTFGRRRRLAANNRTQRQKTHTAVS